MNTIDDDLIDRLRAELDSLTADVSGAPPGLPTDSLSSVVAMPPRRDRRRVLVLAAAMIALIAAVAALVVRKGDDAVGSVDSAPGTASVVTLAPPAVAAHPIPSSPQGWDLVEWGNVRLSLPPDMSPYHTGNGCVVTSGTDLEVVCGDESVSISSAPGDAITDQFVNGLRASWTAGECVGCETLVVPELTSTVTVRRHDDGAANSIVATVGPSGTWRYGYEIRPAPPADFTTVNFEGASLRFPTDWRVQSVGRNEASPCPSAVIPNTVLLDLGIPSTCDDPLLHPPTDGVRLYLAEPPIDTHPGWPEQTVGMEFGGAAPTVVMRVGYGVDPSIGLTILSSFADVSPDTSTTYATVAPIEVPYFAVGESVMLGAKPNLDARGIRTVADVSKGPDWELQQLQQAKSEFHITGGVVLQLGTNATVSRREYDAVLAEVSDLPRVVVMTVKADRPWIQGNNEIIRSLPLTHPNVLVLDWEARSAEVADHLASDGTHLGDDVAKTFYTNLILEALGLPTS